MTPPIRKCSFIAAILMAFPFGSTAQTAGQDPGRNFSAQISVMPTPLRQKALAAQVALEQSGNTLDPIQKQVLGMLADQQPDYVPPVSFCFAPGTSEEYIKNFYSKQTLITGGIRFFGTARWGRTATDGSGLTQGSRTTLTWGILADGAPVDSGAVSDLRAFLNGIYGNQAVWQALMQQVFDRWAELAAVDYVFEPNDDGAPFGATGTAGALGVRADIRIGGAFIDGPSGTLAYNYSPNNGDMLIDTADTFFNNVTGNSLGFRNVFAHEHGHGLGFAHTCPSVQTKLMEPFVSRAYDGPQHDDILAANKQYGDTFEPNNTSGEASVLGTGFADGTHVQTNLSLYSNSDVDYYRFTTAQGGRKVTVTLSAVGQSYLEGSQNQDGTCNAGTTFNSLALRNLGFEILDSNGTTSLGSANAAAAGANEVLTGIQLGGGTGPFFIRVFGGGIDQVQMYDFQLELSDGAPAPEIDILGGTNSISDGDTTPSVVDGTVFGTVTVGNTVTNTFSITNEGNLELTLTLPIAISGAAASDFSISAPPAATLAEGTGTSFDVVFNPTASGARNATITIINNDSTESPYTFDVTGTGDVTPEISVSGNGTEIVNGDTTPTTVDFTDFGSVDILTGAPQSVFVISNLGTATLNLTLPVTLSGAGAGSFSIVSAPSAAVAIGGSTSFTVRFDPSAIGAASATVTVNNDDVNEAVYDFTISGTGISSPEISILGNGQTIVSGDNTPSAADDTDFGQVNTLGSAVTRTYTVRNTGSGNLNVTLPLAISGANANEFSVTANPTSTISPGGSSTFDVSFDPNFPGNRSGVVTLTSDDLDEGSYFFSLGGEGIVEPNINVSGNGVSIAAGDVTPDVADHTDFGSVAVAGSPITRTFVITNSGSATLTLNQVPAITGANAADFTLNNSPSLSVPINTSTSFDVSFAPGAAGLRVGTITIGSDDPDQSSYAYAIAGRGTEPEMAVFGNAIEIPDGNLATAGADGTDFGTLDVLSGSTTHVFVLTNSGATNLNIGSVVFTGLAAADFTAVQLPASIITPGVSSELHVTYDPVGTGVRTAIVTIANDDANENPYDFVLGGVSTGAEIAVLGNNIEIPDGATNPNTTNLTDFGIGNVGATLRTNTFSITNSGTGIILLTLPITFEGIAALDFVVLTAPGTNRLVTGASTTFDVTFTPRGGGVRLATLTLTNDDVDEAIYDFQVRGSGFGPEIELLGNNVVITNLDTTPDFADHTLFGAADINSGFNDRVFTITNLGTTNLNVLPIQIVGLNPADFTVITNPTPSQISLDSSATFAIRFDPTLPGARSAQVWVLSDDFDESPYQFNVEGSGFAIPPLPLQQPLARNVNALETASFLFSVSGTPPISYQWFRNGVSLAGANGPTLTYSQATANETGAYKCIASNVAGSLTSSEVQLNVARLPSSVNWLAPAAIVYGTALGASQLNAAATAAGSIVYSPPTGTVLPVGLTNLGAVFTPLLPEVYLSSSNTVSITVTPAPLTISADDKSKLEGDVNPTLTATYTGFVNGDTLTNLTTPVSLSTTAIDSSPVGDYPITSVGATSPNYAISLVDGTLSVVSPLPTIQTQPISQTVDALTSVSFTVVATGQAPLSYQWRKGGVDIPGAATPTLNLASVSPTDSGSYTVVVNNSVPGTATSAAAILIVTQLIPTITWTNALDIVYGTLLDGTQLNATAGVGGTFVYTPPAGFALSVGTRVLGASFTPADTNNYSTVNPSVIVTVTPAPLTVTADDKMREIGTANPPLTFTATGYQFGQDDMVLIPAPSLFTAADLASTVGNYPIATSNSTASNYVITFVEGTLGVFAIPPSITTEPTSVTLDFGQDSAFSVAASGSEPLSYQWRRNGSPVGGATATVLNITGATSAESGFYDVVVSNAGGSITSAVATLTVIIPPTIVTAPVAQTLNARNNAIFSVVAGGSIPLTYQWQKDAGDLAGQTNASLILPSLTSADAGSYRVVISNSAGSVTSAGAALTVNLLTPLVTWFDPADVVYGTPLGVSQLTAAANVPGSFSYTPTNGTVLAVGTRTLNGTFTPTETNVYEVINRSVALDVTTAPLTITADDKTREFGQTNPSLTASYSGFVNGEGPANLTMQTTLATTANAASDIGNYPITANGAASPDYTITEVAGNLEVTAVPPAFTAQPIGQTVNAGDSVTFAATVSGASTVPLSFQWRKGGVNLSGQTSASLTLNAVLAADRGSYDVVASNAGGSLTSSGALLNVRVPTSLAWLNPAVVVYGTALGTAQLNASASAAGSIVYTPPLTTVLAAGSQTLSAVFTPADSLTGLGTNASVTLVVDPAVLTVIAENKTREFGLANPSLTVIYSGFVNGEDASVLTNLAALTTMADVASLPAGYPITVADAAASNYTSSFFDGTLTVFATLPVLVSPADRTVIVGEDASFVVGATGTAPLDYQWRKNGTDIPGANAPTLNITGAQSSDAAGYDAVVSNVSGSVTSLVANLTVNIPPTITVEPQSQTFGALSDVVFSVNAMGTAPLVYQWARNGVDLSGQTSSILLLSSVTTNDIGSYRVTVSNVAGNVQSVAAALSVNQLAATLLWATPADVPYGTLLSSGQLNAGAAVAGVFSYTPDLGERLTTGPHTLSVIFAPNDLVNFVVESNSVNLNVTNAVLTVFAEGKSREIGLPNPTLTAVISGFVSGEDSSVLTAQPVLSTTADVNSQAGLYPITVSSAAAPNYAVSFVPSLLTVFATAPGIVTQPESVALTNGTGTTLFAEASGSAPLSYQWRFNGSDLGGETTTNLVLVNLQPPAAGAYDLVVSNVAGMITSEVANVVVYVPPAIVQDPQPATVNALSTVTFTAVATGTSPLFFQWKKDGLDILHATNTTIAFNPVTPNAAGTYSLAVTNVAGFSISAAAVLTVGQLTPTLSWSGPAALNYGTPLGTNELGVTAAVPGNLVYTPPLGTVLPAGNHTLNVSFTPGDTLNYSAAATSVSIDVNPAPLVISAESKRREFGQANPTLTASYVGFVNGETPVSLAPPAVLSTTADTNSGLGDYPILIGGATSVNYTINFVNSTLTVFGTAPVFVQTPAAQTVIVGNGATFSVAATGTAPLSYQWRHKGLNISGATSATLLIPAVQISDAGGYDVVVSNVAGAATSSSATLTVNAPPTVNVQPVTVAVHAGMSALFSVEAIGSGTLLYQWRKDGLNVLGATSRILTLNATAVGDAGSYDVVVSSSAGFITSAAASLSVDVVPILAPGPQSITAANGSQIVTLSGTAFGAQPISYFWRQNGVLRTGLGFNGPAVAFRASGGNLGAWELTIANAFGQVVSEPAVVTRAGVPLILSQPISRSVLVGDTVEFKVQPNGSQPFQIQWLKDGQFIPGNSGLSLTVSNIVAADAGDYSVVIGNLLGFAVSQTATLTVVVPPVFVAQPVNQLVSLGSNARFDVSVSTFAPVSFQWRKDGVPILGQTSGSYNIASAQVSDIAGYDVVVANIAGSLNSSVANLAIAVPPVLTMQPVSTDAGLADRVELESMATGSNPLAYQWRKDGVVLAGRTNVTLLFPSVSRQDRGLYSVVVSNAVGTVSSTNATLIVRQAQEVEKPSLGVNGRFSFSFGDMGGSQLTPDLAPNFLIEASANLKDWKVVSSNGVGMVFTNGQFRFIDLEAPQKEFRYYRIIEP